MPRKKKLQLPPAHMPCHDHPPLVPQDWLVQAWLNTAKARGVLPPTATEDDLLQDKEGLGFQTPCSSIDTMTKHFHEDFDHSMPSRVFSLHPHAFCVMDAPQDKRGTHTPQVCVTARVAQALQSGNKLPTPNGLWLDRAQTGEGMMGEVWHDWDDHGEYHFCLSEDVQPGALCTVCVDELQATHVCDNCMKALCAECFAFHQKRRVTLRHKRVREINMASGPEKHKHQWTSVEAL